MKTKAFTLAEILIALIIVGIVSTAVIGSINNSLVKQTNKKAFQKCYTHMSQTISDMLNDKMAYPDIPISESDLTLIGLANNYTADGTIDEYKFYKEFKKRTLGAITTTPTASYLNYRYFTAQDKSLWAFTSVGNTTEDKYRFMEVLFDVNGLDKGPNCPVKFTNTEIMPSSCTDPDRFVFFISGDGKIVPTTSTGWNSSMESTFLYNNGYLGIKE